MIPNLAVYVAVVYAMVETMEKFGMSRRVAHLIAIPLGVGVGFLAFPGEPLADRLLNGIFIGIAAVGSCDTACNVADAVREKAASGSK